VDAARLKGIPVLADLTDEERDAIASLAAEVSVPAGKELVREGDYSYELLAVEEGTAKVEKGGELIAELGPGDIIGEMGVLDRSQRSATVTATSPMLLVTLDRWDAKKLTKLSPSVADKLRELVASRKDHA
jgi:CRP/FNR family transcriptional regulator, cyclic AMP receptor protein